MTTTVPETPPLVSSNTVEPVEQQPHSTMIQVLEGPNPPVKLVYVDDKDDLAQWLFPQNTIPIPTVDKPHEIIKKVEFLQTRGGVDRPITSDQGQVDWENLDEIQFTVASGAKIRIPKDRIKIDQPPATITVEPNLTPQVEANQPPTPPEPPAPSSARETIPPTREVPTEAPTQVTIVGLKAYEKRARAMANQDMQAGEQDKLWNGGPRVDVLVNRIWKHNLLREYFHERAFQIRREQLEIAQTPFAEKIISKAEENAKARYEQELADKNFFGRLKTKTQEFYKSVVGKKTLVQMYTLDEIGHVKDDANLRQVDIVDREVQAVRERFDMAFNENDEMIRTELGEKLKTLDSNSELAKQIRELLKGYATDPSKTREQFEAEVNTFYSTVLAPQEPNVRNAADLYVSSLYETAEALRTQFGHEEGTENLDNHLLSMSFRIAVAQMGEATSLEPTETQQMMDRLGRLSEKWQKRGFVKAIATSDAGNVAAGVALALCAKNFVRAPISGAAKVIVPVAGSAVGGVFAAAREKRRLKEEYRIHVSERERGLLPSASQERRKFFEQFSGIQRSAQELYKGMRDPLLTPEGQLKSTLNIIEVRSAVANYADTRARRRLTDSEKGLGLISFTSRNDMETERTMVDRAIRTTEQDLANLATSNPDLLRELTGGKDIQEFLDTLTDHQVQIIQEGQRILMDLGDTDPVKMVLQIAGDFTPEADIVRRKVFGSGQTETVQGLTQIDKELGKAINRRAVKRGVMVAGVGMLANEALADIIHVAQTGNVEMVGAIGTTGRFIQENLGGNAPAAALSVTPINFNGHNFITDQHVNITPQVGNEALIDGPQGQITIRPVFDASGNVDQTTIDQLRTGGVELEVLHSNFSPGAAIDTSLHMSVTDTAGGVHDLVASIPAGTQLVASPTPGVFEMHITDPTNPANIITVDNIQFGPQGELVNGVDAMQRINAALSPTGLHMTVGETVTEINAPGGVGGEFDKAVIDMGGAQGREGMWGWFQDSYASSPHPNADNNLAKNLFRGWSENYMPDNSHVEHFDGALRADGEIDMTTIGSDVIFHHIPTSLFGNDGLTKLGALMDETYTQWQNGITPENMDQIHKLVYELGLVGRVATKDEVQFIMDYMGGGAQELHKTIFNIDAVQPNYILRSIADTPDIFPAVPVMPRKALEQISKDQIDQEKEKDKDIEIDQEKEKDKDIQIDQEKEKETDKEIEKDKDIQKELEKDDEIVDKIDKDDEIIVEETSNNPMNISSFPTGYINPKKSPDEPEDDEEEIDVDLEAELEKILNPT